jgi:hypothetical protein
MRTEARPRREVPAPLIAMARPLMRYSSHRDAFVLRGVGNHFGPVIVRREDDGSDGSAGPTRLATRR